MKERYIDVDGAWGVIVCFDYSRKDYPRMKSIMESFGMSEYEIIEAIHVLKQANSGMAVSRGDITMSLVFIGYASDDEQLLDTMAHEIDHVQHAILRHYGIECGGEDAAWLQGYLMREMSNRVVPFM